MYRCDVVVLAQVVRYEDGGVRGGCAVYAVYEVGATLNHSLVDELLERLLLARHAEVEEELVPEARVDEVTRSVLAASYVEVYVLHEACVVVRIHIAQVVSR